MKRLFKQQKEKTSINKKAKINCVKQREIKLSEEQLNYITHNFWTLKLDTILVACAGSGKTKSMIEKMRYLASNQIYNKKQMMVFSYSKLTIEHTKNCFKSYSDFNIFSDDKLIKTIDAFCYDILKKVDINNESCAVQVLSSKFVNMIQTDFEKLKKRVKSSKYGKISVLFVDEAQDLNQIQYEIILFMQKITGCVIHLIGDPNQNIYQFRGSYEKYMLQHPAQMFKLTKNFRCETSIEQFSNFFKYYDQTSENLSMIDENNQQLITDDLSQQTMIDCVTQQSNMQKSVQLFVNSYNENDQQIISLIKQLREEGYKYNNIAILSPIIGDQFNSGIKRIANMFDQQNIPYVPYYSEMKDEQQKKIKTKSKKDGVNLLTIHGSKGLEYSVIILIKLQDKMMFQDQLEQQYFVSQNMNLIYVALTRAMDKLIIIHDDQSNIQNKHICSIIQCIPQELYEHEGNLPKHINVIESKLSKRQQLYDENAQFMQNHTINNKKDILLITKRIMPELFEITQKEVMYQNSLFSWKTSVTRFIQNINQSDMLFILENFMYKKKCEEIYQVPEVQQQLFKTLRTDHEAFVGILFEQIIFYQIQWKKINQSKLMDQSGLQQIPRILGIVFTLKDIIRKSNSQILINQFFVVYNIDQLQEIMLIYNQLKDNDVNQKDADRLFQQFSKQCVALQSQSQDADKKYYIEILDFGTICSGQMGQLDINGQYIFKTIDNYNSNQNWKSILTDIIYISMLKSAIKSKHSKYINYDKGFIDKMCGFDPLFEKLDETVSSELSKENTQYQYEVGTDDVVGFIDFITSNEQENTIIELKVTNETSTEHILQIMLYDFLLELDKQQEMNNRLIIINALKGVRYEILFEKKPELHKLLGELLSQDHTNRCQFSC